VGAPEERGGRGGPAVPAAETASAPTSAEAVPPAARPRDRDPEDARAVRALIERLRGLSDPRELSDGLWELGWIGHPVAIDYLAGWIGDPRDRVVDAAIGALEDIGGPEAARAMGRAFALEGHEAAKLRAVEGLHYLRFEAPDVVVEELTRALSDPSPAVRRDARLALVHFAGPREIARLWRAYRDESTDDLKRSELATVLRQLGETSIPARPVAP